MNYNPFFGAGSWYKGNLHGHSTVSDGTYTPAELKAIYKKHGYSFCVFSDHDQYVTHDDLNDADFIAYPGAEIKVYPAYRTSACKDFRTYHMLCLAGKDGSCTSEALQSPEPLPRAYCDDDHQFHAFATKHIEALKARGFMVTVNHPTWSRLLQEDILHIDGYFALEIWNSQAAREEGMDKGENTLLWDLLLRQGRKVWGYAADDSHNHDYVIFNQDRTAKRVKIDETSPMWASCRGWIQVWAEELSVDALARAMEAGHFYSSTGPAISRYEVSDGLLYLDCDRVKSVDVICFDNRGFSYFDEERGISKIRHRLTGLESYVRLHLTAFDGSQAWTNPIFFD